MPQKKSKRIKVFWEFLGLFFLLPILGALILFFSYTRDFPRPEVFTERQLPQSTKIYDRTGKILLYELYGEEKRTWASLDKIPDYFKNAAIATEDADFYRHFGVDLKGAARAVLSDLRIKKFAFGGSTIPQQLIRSTFLSSQKTAQRKTREIILAIELDRRHPKDKILEWYLNQVPFGQNAYGVQAASQIYFQKNVSDISLAEAAVLTALIQAPSRLSPYGENKNRLLARKDYVLDRLAAEKYIARELAEETKKEEIKFSDNKTKLLAPYFTLWIKQQLEDKYEDGLLQGGGLKIYTSLNWDFQTIAEQAVREGIERNKAYNAHNAGLVAIDPKTGEVLAMAVGSGDYNSEPFPKNCIPGQTCLFDPKFNVVVSTKEGTGRQPGSAFKPFVYATAFKKGYDDKYIVIDEPTNFGVWGGKEYAPQNYDGNFRGPVSLRQSLAQSLNVPAVKILLNLAGLEDSVKTAQDLGLTTLKPPFGPAIVLGGWEVKLLEMTSAYGVFATEGLKVDAIGILKIEGSKGEVIFQNRKTLKRVLETGVAKLISSILSDNESRAPMFGPRSNLFFENYQVAAKTGTTDDFRDAWTIGYTPSIAVGVWAGNNNNEPIIRKQPAATVAGPIFHEFLEKLLVNFPRESFAQP